MGSRTAATGTRRSVRPPFGSRTDIGRARDHNEDSLFVAAPLFVVADGMGGHAAGEVASEVAVHTMQALAPTEADTAALGQAVMRANLAVIEAAGRSAEREGMGTTITAAVVDHERLAIAQVGDSRAYLLHQGRLQQLTRDHSLVADMVDAGEITKEEARIHPKRSVITRALGCDPAMQPDLYELNVSAGDRLLLCSDGLTTMVRDERIESILSRTHDPQRAANALVREANEAGGFDNVTVIVVDIQGNAEQRQRKIRRRSRALYAAIVVMLVAIVGAICYGAYAFTQQCAYLTANDAGTIDVYRGVPDTIAGIGLSTYDHTEDISVDSLQPGTANRLRSGAIRTDSLEEANALVESYREELADETASDQASDQDATQAEDAE